MPWKFLYTSRVGVDTQQIFNELVGATGRERFEHRAEAAGQSDSCFQQYVAWQLASASGALEPIVGSAEAMGVEICQFFSLTYQ